MITILVVLIILGVALYLVELIPMDATIKTIIKVLAILFVVLYVLQLLGVWHGMPAGIR
jgi:hypothetical protein